MNDARSQINRMMAPIVGRIRNIAARAVVLAVNDALKMQGLKVGLLADETKDGVERFQSYGFTAVPLSGSEAVVLFPGGGRDHGIAIVVEDRRHRLKNLQPGEAAMYTHRNAEGEGLRIVLLDNRTIEIVGKNISLTAEEKVIITAPQGLDIDAPKTEATGTIKDLVASTGKRMDEMRTIYNGHTHGGITPGGGTTGDAIQDM